MNTDPNRLERRSAQRFEVHLPLAIHFDGGTAAGFTQDLSGRGIFFYAERVPLEGAYVEVSFMMPSEITLAENMPVRCGGRVVRAIPSQGGQQNGIAVQLDSYEYLPSSQPASPFARVSSPRGTRDTSHPVPRRA
jgi:PilZ domain